MFGGNFQFALNTYAYLDLPTRSYNSFYEMGKNMADSRVYGGLHYRETHEKSLIQGKKVAENIMNNVKFKKE